MRGLYCVYTKISEQFKKREKHPWRSVTSNKVTGYFTKSNTRHVCFYTFYKLFKWYQIAQRIKWKDVPLPLYLRRSIYYKYISLHIPLI